MLKHMFHTLVVPNQILFSSLHPAHSNGVTVLSERLSDLSSVNMFGKLQSVHLSEC